MEYIVVGIIVIFVLYQLFGKSFFGNMLMDKMVERVAAPSLKYPSDSTREIIIAMYFYYACLIFTCQKRNLSKFTRTLVDTAFRKTISNVFKFKELPQEEYLKRLQHVFDIMRFLEEQPHPEVLQDLILSSHKNESKFGLNLTFDNLDLFAKACEFYTKKVGPTVDFLLETSKHYPDK